MNKNKRYVFIPINVRLNEYEFYDDLITNRFFEYEKEPLALPINPRAYIDFDNSPPSLSNSKYCIVGFLEMSNKYWTEESNELLMFLPNLTVKPRPSGRGYKVSCTVIQF